MSTTRLILGDCLDVLPTLEAGSVDAVITDPPYPEISRPYGRMTEVEWHAMIHALIPEVRRVLKPRGSAVFVLQPNSERVGRMRTWLWEFMAWVGKEWGIVQDVWWWNYTSPPTVHCQRMNGLMRPSVKACVWLGNPDCYRDQDAVLWDVSDYTVKQALRSVGRAWAPRLTASGHNVDDSRACQAPIDRGGSAPFNLIPISNGHSTDCAGLLGHGAGTPLALCSWWCSYLCPPGGTVLDPFSGSGTVGLAAQQHGCSYVGVEKMPEYHAIAQRRLSEAQGPLFAGMAANGSDFHPPSAPSQGSLFPEP
jgi:DNA modification methylase